MQNNDLINELKNLDETVDVMIITNIPSRMQNYYNTNKFRKSRITLYIVENEQQGKDHTRPHCSFVKIIIKLCMTLDSCFNPLRLNADVSLCDRNGCCNSLWVGVMSAAA